MSEENLSAYLNTRFTEDEKQAIEQIAKDQDRTPSQWVRMVCRKEMRKIQKAA